MIGLITKWEYKIINIQPCDIIMRILENMGADGWELIFKDGPMLYFKRPINELPDIWFKQG
jgi:hypothetical protein